MREIKNEYVFLSGDLSSLPWEIRAKRNMCLEAILDDLGVNYNRVVGSYRFNLETSFMVKLEPSKGFTVETLKAIAFEQFDQESVLEVDKNNKAFLHYQDNTWENIGTIGQITEAKAVDTGNYTYLPWNKTYLGVK